ncbi:cupin-like domain-containing protein [Massilia sp. PWRC2]|uniref:cupin-like domain-containing protein n=1 Tax=Massilia sp. PWRC2 TaxID=2804626 RepID=UPI003CEDD98B
MVSKQVPPHDRPPAAAARRLPPRLALPALRDDAVRQARARKDAAIRAVHSIAAMRDAIRAAARAAPAISAIARFGRLDGAAFRQQAARGLPFLIDGVVKRWPLTACQPSLLREAYASLPVRARVGDYINTAFAADRAMQDMSMGEYLDLVEAEAGAASPGLPPYLGNLALRELNRLCHWPAYFDKLGPPRFWIGPARTVTPLHCDFDDNIFAQIWGSKRITLAPPHHDAYLYVREANPLLFGSPVDPEALDLDQFPLARQATFIECIVKPGDLLYVPAGWYHQVRALTFSLSSNRWARAMPLALHGDVARRLAPGAAGDVGNVP